MSLKSLYRRASLRLRLTVFFVIVFGLTMGGFGYATIEFLRQSLEREFDVALHNYAVDVVEGISLDSEGDLLLAPRIDKMKVYPFALGNALIQIRHRSGAILSQVGLWGELKVPHQKEFERLAREEDVVYSTVRDLSGLPLPESGAYRVIHFPIDSTLPPQLILQIAVPTTILENQLTNRHRAFEAGIPLILLVATVTSYLLAGRALHPIRVMVNQANSIGAQELSRRLPVPEPRDELRQLALTLNQMLDRIEKAFASQEKFVADASHQLLTPLTVIKGALESAQRQGRMSDDNIAHCLQEVDHLTNMVRGLLALERLDAGLSALQFQPVYLDEVILEAISKVEPLARGKDIRLKFDLQDPFESGLERPLILGEEDLLLTLVFNLLENAVKYSNDQSQVRVQLSWNKETQHLSIEDSGPGISPESQELIFERFRRGREAEQAGQPGFGLGLAIARKIATVHSGRLWVESKASNSRGATFHFEIPWQNQVQAPHG